MSEYKINSRVFLFVVASCVGIVAVFNNLSAQEAVKLRDPGPDASEVDWIEYLTLRLNQKGVKTHPTYLPDGSQVDILTDSVAWEVERCKKWKESIGQSIFYAEMTHRTPGVWILKEGGDEHDFTRFMVVVTALRGTEKFRDFRVRVIDIRSGREWGK